MKPIEMPFCCACGKIRDEGTAGVNQGAWIDLRTYMTKHGLRHGDFVLRYTYCPECSRIIEIVRVQGV